MADEFKYFSVGDLRKFIEGLDDSVPVLSAPLNEKIRVALDINMVEKGKIGDYEGKIVIFNTGLFDIDSGKRILITPKAKAEEETDEQGNDKELS